jgi:hypothetical protein
MWSSAASFLYLESNLAALDLGKYFVFFALVVMSPAFNLITTPFPFQSWPLGARQEEFLIVGKVASCLILALILWRLWRFTVSPFLHPERPKEFPYWVPCKFSLGKVAWTCGRG